MDLAIACLRKSNELSDHERRPLLTQKEYMRLVKYIEATGDMQTALLETERIYKKHPEFLDKRVTNKLRFSEAIQKAQKNGTDLLYITTNNHCPVCKNYNHKIFSISGKSKDYPKLPKEFLKDGGFDESCIVGVSLKII